ncbi:MAG TPA: AAA family ATPase, partial [Granulicella sp.]
EPEAHLHPPLQAAFIRVLSSLLSERNGVALIASHSPVMLQEVPRECVWILQNFGSVGSIARPTIETFAENVGILTREVFKLEVTYSGFHTLLQRAVDESRSIEEVFEYFNDKLGAEGRAVARALWRAK